MKTNRRKFLSLLGVGTAAGPLAVKAAADAEISNLTKISGNAIAGGAFGGLPGAPEQPGGIGANIPYETKIINSSNYIRMFGVPEVVAQQCRDSSKYIHALDPDIACKKTWSMSVKIQHQRERNYERQIEWLHKAGPFQQGKKALSNILGYEWPW